MSTAPATETFALSEDIIQAATFDQLKAWALSLNWPVETLTHYAVDDLRESLLTSFRQALSRSSVGRIGYSGAIQVTS